MELQQSAAACTSMELAQQAAIGDLGGICTGMQQHDPWWKLRRMQDKSMMELPQSAAARTSMQMESSNTNLGGNCTECSKRSMMEFPQSAAACTSMEIAQQAALGTLVEFAQNAATEA